MSANANSETNRDAIDCILAADEEIVPTSGFLAATMERVRAEAAAPAPIPFPLKRVVPGILLAMGVLGWATWETVRYMLAGALSTSFSAPHLSPMATDSLHAAGWVALALAVSYFSWMLSLRLVRRSGLL